MSALILQLFYQCERCKAAADIHGRGCRHGLLFPVLLMMAGKTKCPNYEYDADKLEERGRQAGS